MTEEVGNGEEVHFLPDREIVCVEPLLYHRGPDVRARVVLLMSLLLPPTHMHRCCDASTGHAVPCKGKMKTADVC